MIVVIVMRGHISFFCYFELICWHIYVSHATSTQYLRKGHTHFYIYEVAFLSHTYIILRVINVSPPLPEASRVIIFFRLNNIITSFLHVMPLQTPQAGMHMTPFFLQHRRLLQSP